MSERFDTILIGAGAAGLAAARDLSGAGKRVCILEARERIGGRIWTLHVPDLPLPIELGAEFIHGEADETFAIVQAAALLAYQLPDNHWWSSGGRWRRVNDFWGTIDRLRARIPTGAHDVSFAEFLKRQRAIAPKVKRLAAMFVEGYHAAHADRISAASLRGSDEEQEEHKQFRIANGYDAVMEWLRAGVDPTRSTIRLGSAVTQIKWKRGEVQVLTERGETFRGSAAVITIPIGVWKAPEGQAGAIEFIPPLREKQLAIEKLEVGHVVHIVFRFRERFWERRAGGLAGRTAGRRAGGDPATEPVARLNFIHSADRFMPTWWTTAPVRAPLLTGWAGGHAADALLAEGSSALIGRALDSLAAIFGMRRRDIDRLFDSAHFHDWQADPFTRGAYSYAGVGGKNAAARLAKPIAKTLFFAGEATSGDQTGTVAGAIASGKRAAREILA